MNRALRRMVAAEDCYDSEEGCQAYAYDASGLEALPAAALRPRDPEQLRRILVHANQYRLAVVARGAATGVRGGAVRDGAIVVDLRAFDKVERLDTQRDTVDVGAGCTARALAERLGRHGYRFPLLPANPESTIGGLAARNHVTEESQLFGDWHELVERLDCFDGLGRLQTLKGAETAKVLGKEGATGIILKLRLRLVKEHRTTLELHPVGSPSEALRAALGHAGKPGLLLLEYLDGRCSRLLGLEAREHLLAAYANDRGSYKDPARVRALLDARKRLPLTLWNEGLLHEVEATVEEEQVERFVARAAAKGLPCYGHLGIGIMIAALPDRESARAFRDGIVSIGAVPGGKHGYGRLLKGYLPDALRKEVGRLKEERDYNNVLNPGVLA